MATSGAWRARTPISPAAPGTMIISTSPSNAGPSGVTRERSNFLASSATSAPASDAAESLGREHQARGRTRPQQGWSALLRARVDSGAACSRARGRRVLPVGALGQDGARSQLATELDEERFERKRWAQVELLEGAPGLADELAGALSSGKA